MKHLLWSVLTLALFFSFSPSADARPPRHDHDRREDRGRHDRHDRDHRHGRDRDHRDFGPGRGHHGDHYRHHSAPRRHPILGSYFKRPGYYGRDYYGKRIWHPILGTIYVR